MSNVSYRFEGNTGYGTLPDGTTFLFDADRYDRICEMNWYRNYNDISYGKQLYITSRYGTKIHDHLVDCPDGYEVDHINLNTLDNRSCNLRFATHRQNQCNQPLQRNNTSGVSGVSYYPPRKKYRARIKANQHDIHLGYYDSFIEAVQARNVGMECMFGEFGRYNDVPPTPAHIRNDVQKRCRRFANDSACEFFDDM